MTSRRKNELEERMLLNLSKRGWTAGLRLADFAQHSAANEKVVKELKGLAERCARGATEGRGAGVLSPVGKASLPKAHGIALLPLLHVGNGIARRQGRDTAHEGTPCRRAADACGLDACYMAVACCDPPGAGAMGQGLGLPALHWPPAGQLRVRACPALVGRTESSSVFARPTPN